MKATIDVPDELYRRVKVKCAQLGKPVREVTVELYQRWLAGEPSKGPGPAPEAWLRRWLDELGSPAELQVDGGVTPANARLLAEAGASCLVAGSSVFGPDGAAAGLARLREALA